MYYSFRSSPSYKMYMDGIINHLRTDQFRNTTAEWKETNYKSTPLWGDHSIHTFIFPCSKGPNHSQEIKQSYQRSSSLTWDFIGYDWRRTGLVSANLLVGNHVTALRHRVVYHVKGIWHIGHSDHPQTNEIGLFHHHLIQYWLQRQPLEPLWRHCTHPPGPSVSTAPRPPRAAASTAPRPRV